MKVCLLVVDMQKGIFGLKQPVYDAENLIRNVNKAICFAREQGIRVIFTQHENGSFLKSGTAGHGIVGEIKVCNGDVLIAKKHPDAFLDTGLDGMLKAQGITGLIVAGLISNGCVKDACLSALEKGYVVILPSDAHSTFYSGGKKIVETVNRDMDSAGARVAPVEELPRLCF